jgi:hypothetical protein
MKHGWQPPPGGDPGGLGARQVNRWIDDAHFARVERVPDRQSVFNFRVQFSDQPMHVVKNRPGGPLVITGQYVLDDDTKGSLDDLSAFSHHELKARVREWVSDGPDLYHFLDEAGNSVSFGEMDRVRIERFVYPDAASQHALMNGFFEVGKTLIHIKESFTTLIERFALEYKE